MLVMQDNWYGRLGDIVNELIDEGYDVLESNEEYVVAGIEEGDEDVQYVIRLGGTATTITIDRIDREVVPN